MDDQISGLGDAKAGERRHKRGRSIIQHQGRTSLKVKPQLFAIPYADGAPAAFHPHAPYAGFAGAARAGRQPGLKQPRARPHAHGNDFQFAIRVGIAVEPGVLAVEASSRAGSRPGYIQFITLAAITQIG